jgi:hypothetical protein
LTNPFDFLQSWYRAQLNGEWEHTYGVTIETLDNPGWMVTIDLEDTPLHDQTMPAVRQERSPKDWLVCYAEHNKFRGQGDEHKLPAILTVFQNWVQGSSPPPSQPLS